MPTNGTVLDNFGNIETDASPPVSVDLSLEGFTDNGDTDVIERLDTLIEVLSTEETVQEETESIESLPASVEIVNEHPLAVVLVDEESVSTYAVTGDVYAGTIGTTYLEYFKGYVNDLPYNMDYLLFRPSNNSYLFFYGEDLQERRGIYWYWVFC